ncbi:MAG TPA: FAD-binding oxidoreductase [Streptosporangiaceae bacterium]|nr:FAD-binding oxidoreductase [Streptosporangiaceae bacterium]
MTHTVIGGIGGLRTGMEGPVVVPGDADFDDRRRVWNADIDRRPAVIARCASAADVATAIGFAREHDLEVAVRGGAHDASGLAACNDGMMIDLSMMNDVRVDPQARRAQVGGGALLADVDAASQAHGLAMPAGLISHTGVGGLTLGGGMGWLTRQHGLSIDNLLSAEVVTADGRTQRASATENPDLFWGIRGGGGNFGVVTNFEFQLHQVDPTVQFGLFFWPIDQGPQALRLAAEIVGSLPDDVSAIIGAVNAPPAPFVPQEHHFQPGYVLLLTGFGAARGHAELAEQIRRTLPPLFDLVTPMPYVAVQQLLDEANAWGVFAYDKGAYIEDLTDDIIQLVTERVAAKTSPMSALLLYRLDGAYTQAGDTDTAFSGGRSPRYAAFLIGVAPDAGALAGERTWVRGFWDALRPYAIAGGDGYVNGTADHSQDRVRGSYGPVKYQRLAGIKAQYDPENIFHLNANIRPA